jgi:glycosyltransferase involved in cell wall biosynthesis
VNFSPISVVIPVYHCAERLPEHIESLRGLRDQVHEFIWVITESPDGSHQLARGAAKELGGKVLEVPRGLYQAWNAGIGATTGEFIYISTVGDTIQTEGLATLRRTLEETGADMVFSPPIIHPPSRKNIKNMRHWPLFRFASVLASFTGRKIPRKAAVLMQILAGASGLTGSAASCLFRASALKSRPFPTNHHHYGDTAWLYENLPEISLGYCPKPLARFVIHSTDIVRVVDKGRIYDLIIALARVLPSFEQSVVKDLIQANIQINAIRDPHPRLGWWIIPKAWQLRMHRDICKGILLRSLSRCFFREPLNFS